MTATRRLAAILAADVAGYSRLMGADEEGTLERLKVLRRELIDPKMGWAGLRTEIQAGISKCNACASGSIRCRKTERVACRLDEERL
jgi:class 3 adenylate cyclase